MTTYLFLKPRVTTTVGQGKQIQDIRTFIVPTIKRVGLVAIDNLVEGLEVCDISDDVIRRIYKADILIIDANCYEANGDFRLSPYLYYYMAVGHSRGNATILVTDTIGHLPHNLIGYHTLTYSLADIVTFTDQFRAVVEEIRQRRDNGKPDNPVQYYLHLEYRPKERQHIAEMEEANRKELAEANQRIAEMEEVNRKELAEANQRIAEMEEVLAEARRRIEEMEADNAQQRQAAGEDANKGQQKQGSRFTYRKVN